MAKAKKKKETDREKAMFASMQESGSIYPKNSAGKRVKLKAKKKKR